MRRFQIGLAVFVMMVSSACGQIITEKPDGMDGVGITEHRGDTLPLDLEFKDSEGRIVTLGEYFAGDQPVLLSFNYASCPMLCKLQLNGLIEGLRDLKWTAGEQYRVVSISIDPSETTRQAAIAKQKHLNAYGRPGSGDGWAFLTGSSENIRAAAKAAGFVYRYLPDQKEYSHAAAIMVCTPTGQLSQYLYGVQFDRQTLRLSLADASDGKVGSALDQLLLFCFRYDSAKGKYAPVAWNIMRVGALGTVFAMTVCVAPFWFRSRRQASDDNATDKPAQPHVQEVAQ